MTCLCITNITFALKYSRKPSPYIHIRNGLYALMSRPVYYQLADLAVYRSKDNILGVWSSGVFFELAEAEEEVNN